MIAATPPYDAIRRALVGVAIAGLAVSAAQAQSSAPVVLTFSTVGDSRQDPITFDKASVGNALSGQDSIWLQNTKAFARILRTIQAQKSTMLFFNGDMVHGYGLADVGYTSNANQTTISSQILPTTKEAVIGSDLMKFYQQYGFWRGMVAPVFETGTYVFPVPGNHETECKACPKNSDGQRVAKVENEQAWAANMGDLIVDTARFTSILGAPPANPAFGPVSAGPDGLSTDQSKLGYSFDYKNQHFVIVNTDPVGAETSGPTQWLAADLAAARSRNGLQKIFIFGHKPAFTYDYLGGINGQHATGAGLDATVATTAKRDAFWNVIEQYQATYFCGHEHIYNISRPRGGAYQVIVGGGGSPFDDAATNNGNTVRPSTDRSYSWMTVKVHSDGAVDMLGYGFDEHFGATQLYDQIYIAP